jgi:hypothetical protein
VAGAFVYVKRAGVGLSLGLATHDNHGQASCRDVPLCVRPVSTATDKLRGMADSAYM